MTRLRDRSIQQKITIVTMAICSVVLFLACAVFFFLQARTIKAHFAHELALIGKMTAHDSLTALLAGDAEAAGQTLVGLKTMPEIVGARLVRSDGQTLARFGPKSDEAALRQAIPHGESVIRGTRIFFSEPIMKDGEHAGMLYLVADSRLIWSKLLQLYGGALVVLLGASLLLALLLSRGLRRFITGPILHLTTAARTVAEEKDYTVRARKTCGGELGLLTDAFNQMLAQIQSQDNALLLAQRELRIQVAAQARLTAILETTPDLIGSADPDGALVYLNRAARETFGAPDEGDVSGKKFLDFHPEWAAKIILEEAMPAALEKGSWAGETAIINRIGQEIDVSQVLIADKDADGNLRSFSSIMRDMTERRHSDQALRDSQQRLVETSRLAGMAEVATGVLHNVGNVLNSVNVSAGLVVEKLRRSKAEKVGKAAALLTGRNGNLGDYLHKDEKGKKLPGYLAQLGEFLVTENQDILREVDQLGRNIEHIKEVVAMQQSYAKVSGAMEDLPVRQLVDDAIAMNTGAFERHGVVVQKRFSEVPNVRVDRHKVLQILINLIRNAKYALDDVQRIDKRITISISATDDEQVCVMVADNGVGISEENLTRIFAHGFTTRPDGHGFGLHSGALAASSMGGSLSVASLGTNRGATFTLHLPVAPALISQS